MESLKNGKCVLESPWKVLEFFVQKRVRTLSQVPGIICFFTSIKRPANYLSLKYLDLNFFTYTVDAKRPKKLVNDVLHFFCTLSTRRNTVHFNYVPSVLELELLMGWKCTWCFVTINFGIIFIYVHFLKAFYYIESIKSCLLPFLSNLYCTSIKRRTSIERSLFKVPRVAA